MDLRGARAALSTRRRRSTALVVVTTAVFAAIVGVAVANHTDNMFPTANTGWVCQDATIGGVFCQTDNNYVTVYRESSVSVPTNIGGVLDQEFRPTNLDVAFTAPTYSGAEETDIIYQEGSGVPSGLAGITWCDNGISTLRCDQHYVRFAPGWSTPELACHESGHAVGLTHGNIASPTLSNGDNSLGCMQTPVPNENDGRLGAHNREIINATY